jgi:hypothetical protein
MKGFKVVVFEKTSRGGTMFNRILNPGDSPIKGRNRFLSITPKYTCFAVSSDNNLNIDMETRMTLAAQQQYFTLNSTVYFYVSSAKLMARAFETDPVRRIKDELEKRLKKNVLQSKIHIQDVLDNFFAIKEKILSYSTLNQIREFAGEFGVIIKEVDMTYTIPEKYLQAGRKEDDYYLEKKTAHIDRQRKDEALELDKEKLYNKNELRKIERTFEKSELHHENELIDINNTQELKNPHHEEEILDIESAHNFRRKMPDLLVEGIDKAVQNIDTPESLEKVAIASMNVINKASTQFASPNNNMNTNQLTTAHNYTHEIPRETGDPMDESLQFLMLIKEQVEHVTTNPGNKNIILSCIDHLMGELRLGEFADLDIIDKYIDKLKEYAMEYRKVLPRHVLEKMSKFKHNVHMILKGEQK